MKHPEVPSFQAAYPSLFRNGSQQALLTDRDIVKMQRFLETDAPDIAKGGFKKDIMKAELGSQAFRALFSPREDDHTIIIPAEYATGIGIVDDRDAIMRAYAMRELINPRASLLYLPNDVNGEDNLNLSRKERGVLAKQGDFKPLTDRVLTVLEKHHVENDKLTGVGNSQGAAVIASLAAREDVEMHSLSAFLPPDVVPRTKSQLRSDFLRPLKNNFFENIELSKLEKDATFLDQGYLDLVSFALNALGRNNRATRGPVMAGRHEELLRTALSNTPDLTVVRGWTARAPISPAHINRDIGDRLKSEFNSRIENRVVTGDYGDATSANAWLISASFARRAFFMANHPAS